LTHRLRLSATPVAVCFRHLPAGCASAATYREPPSHITLRDHHLVRRHRGAVPKRRRRRRPPAMIRCGFLPGCSCMFSFDPDESATVEPACLVRFSATMGRSTSGALATDLVSTPSGAERVAVEAVRVRPSARRSLRPRTRRRQRVHTPRPNRPHLCSRGPLHRFGYDPRRPSWVWSKRHLPARRSLQSTRLPGRASRPAWPTSRPLFFTREPLGGALTGPPPGVAPGDNEHFTHRRSGSVWPYRRPVPLLRVPSRRARPARTERFEARWVPLADLVAEAGSRLDPDAAPYCWPAHGNCSVPWSRTAGPACSSRTALLNRPMAPDRPFCCGRVGVLPVTAAAHLVKGRPHDLYYWCDICSIRGGEDDC